MNRHRLAACVALFFSGQFGYAETVSSSSSRESIEAFLATKLTAWQRVLNLEEWKVTLVLARRAELKNGTIGGIKWDKGKKTAVMHILDPADYSVSPEAMLEDMEFTVVHELIHLELASLPKSERTRSTEEAAVNNLARALLARSRQ
ncbi:MAG: hypothetical protein SFV54_16600 [Bryobacteraceae bacterium]|nr:hypothetical protein [Bryobacteraceae bacterium]